MDLTKVKKLNIPAGPGSYQYYDQVGKIIYIGKAANLRSRVLSYWLKSAEHTPAKEQMVGRIAKIKWIETDSEIEALLLEANLVKKYQPEYNIMLRDDKRYAYLKISTEEEWPRVFFTRTIEKQGKYFGPFLSSESVREVLKIIRAIWPFRSCSAMPKKVCLYYRIGKCPGMCQYPVSREEYLKTIGEIEKFLEGKRKEIEKNLKLEIGNLEKEEKNEEKENKLQRLKYKLFNLKKVLENSRPLSVGEKYAADVTELAKTLSLPKIPQRIEGYDISNLFGQEAVGSMVVFREGEPEKNQYRKFKIKNVCHCERSISEAKQSRGLTASGEIASSFRGVTPRNDKKSNDTAMLKEILERRFYNDWPQPDLIIVDGGKGQLNACLSVLKKLKFNIPMLAVSKGEGLRSAHAPDKIFFPGMKTPLILPLASPALHIVKRVRDEAHRFAIGFHRQRRSKNWLKK